MVNFHKNNMGKSSVKAILNHSNIYTEKTHLDHNYRIKQHNKSHLTSAENSYDVKK